MADYIERESFIEDIKTEIVNLSMDGLKGTMMPHDELYGFIERIKEQPAADVAPMVHGKWKDVKFAILDSVECSACGRRFQAYYRGYQYCPRCGAKMDEEAKK